MLSKEQENKILEMYNYAASQYEKTKDECWEAYADGIRDTLVELRIEMEGINS